MAHFQFVKAKNTVKMLLAAAALAAAAIATPAEALTPDEAARIGEFLKSLETPAPVRSDVDDFIEACNVGVLSHDEASRQLCRNWFVREFHLSEPYSQRRQQLKQELCSKYEAEVAVDCRAQ